MVLVISLTAEKNSDIWHFYFLFTEQLHSLVLLKAFFDLSKACVKRSISNTDALTSIASVAVVFYQH